MARKCHTPWKRAMSGAEAAAYMRKMDQDHKVHHVRRHPVEPYKCKSCNRWHVYGRPGRKHF